MIEEYKVSLFAQELKTPYPVAPKKLNPLIEEIEKLLMGSSCPRDIHSDTLLTFRYAPADFFVNRLSFGNK